MPTSSNTNALTSHSLNANAHQETMKAIMTQGNGDYDQLVYQDVPIPDIEPGEVLIKVLAAGVNNTEINTRLACISHKTIHISVW